MDISCEGALVGLGQLSLVFSVDSASNRAVFKEITWFGKVINATTVKNTLDWP